MALAAESKRTQLATSEFFRDLPIGALDQLSQNVLRRTFASGDRLCAEGEPGTSAFLVVRGRFAADLGGRVVGEIGRGELVGEMSLLTGEARSATVTAIRDSETLEISAEFFNEVLASHPGCYQAVSRQLVGRLRSVLSARQAPARATVLTVLHDGRDASRLIVDQAAELLDDAALIHDRNDDIAILEATNDVLAIVVGPNNPELRTWALGQSDRCLLVVDAAGHPSSIRNLAADTPVELVLVHPPSTSCPSGTTRWLNGLTVTAHHHVRSDRIGDLERVLRRLRGSETVVVYSGGGARGAAHGGLHRALAECNVAVDAVVGVSAGAVVSTLLAAGYPPDEGERRALDLFAGSRSPLDFTLPSVSLATGARMNEGLKDLAGEHRTFEDLWVPTTFVSANLTTSDIHLHQTGLLWRGLRATTAIPGVFPPVAEPDGLLIDGGLVANLPVDIARRLHPGATIIASDVGRHMELLPDDYPDDAQISGWQATRDRLQRKHKVPGMIRLLAQLTALGGAGTTQARGDLHIEFDLDGFGIFDFKKSASIIDSGYAQCRPIIQEWVDSQHREEAA